MEPESVSLKDVKPALTGYLKDALAMLDVSVIPDDKVVHDVRVLMKRSRAVMKLIADITDREFYSREYGTFREVGRKMCSWRDKSVHRKTLKEFKKEHAGLFTVLKENPAIISLLKKPETAAVISRDLKNEIDDIKDLLSRSSYRIRFRSMANTDPVILWNQMERSYRITADKYILSRNTLRPSHIHEFRKRAKDLLYQLWFFRPLNPKVIKSLEKKMDTLTQNLGKYNDLSQLIKYLGYKYPEDSVFSAMDELILIIRQKQDYYLSRVWPSAFRIFRPGKDPGSVFGFDLSEVKLNQTEQKFVPIR